MLLDLQFCTHIPSYEMVKYYYLFRIVKMFGEKTGLQSLFLCSFRIFPEFLFSFVFVSCRIRFELCCLTRKKEGSSVCGGNVQMVTDVHTYASMLLSCHPGSIGSEWLRIDSRTHPKVPRMVKGFGQFSFTNSMWEFFCCCCKCMYYIYGICKQAYDKDSQLPVQLHLFLVVNMHIGQILMSLPFSLDTQSYCHSLFIVCRCCCLCPTPVHLYPDPGILRRMVAGF